MKKALVLGAGRVARPLIDYLAAVQGLAVTVVDIVASQAETAAEPHDSVSGLGADITDDAVLAGFVREHDVVVSLLPASQHVRVARACLAHGKNLTTASYIDPAMLALDGEARAAGLTLLNECGLDPGIDHMSALKCIEGIKAKGGVVESFRSYCGGLPAPEANTNPLGYKFSWAPRGMLSSSTAPARYLDSGKVVDVPGTELFASPQILDFEGLGSFEGYPNRDALPYREMYGIEDVKTMFRGTLRNPGHCETFYRWVNLGLLAQTPRDDIPGMTYRSFMQSLAGDDPQHALVDRWEVSAAAPPVSSLEWLGLFEDEEVGLERGGNIDVMAKRMIEKCGYDDGERDMILMRHEFGARFGDTEKKLISTLIAYGTPEGETAMARTVGLPLAIATELVLEGKIDRPGVIGPVFPEIYNPVLGRLEGLGIVFEES